jgi:hypothetical protein
MIQVDWENLEHKNNRNHKLHIIQTLVLCWYGNNFWCMGLNNQNISFFIFFFQSTFHLLFRQIIFVVIV